MKSSQKDGIVNKKEDKEAISEEEEEKMWSQGLFGTKTAKSLLNTVYFYNGKIFGLRANEHRMLRLGDIEVSSNMITYRENTSKTFHGGIKDLKKKPRFVKHICHNENNKDHERCLCAIYKKYFDLLNELRPDVKQKAFYFQPYNDKVAFKNCVVGLHSLGAILPNLCESIGTKRKTSHSLRVTCASKLFNLNVEEKLIRDRTGHISNALFNYEKPSSAQEAKVSNFLGPVEKKTFSEADKTSVSNVSESNVHQNAAVGKDQLFESTNNEAFDDFELPDFDFDFDFADMANLFPVNEGPEATNLSSYAANGPAAPIASKQSKVTIQGNVTINNYNYK